MNVLIFFGCFALVVVLGTKLKVNFGFLAAIAGFLITWFYLGENANSYISMFPTRLFWNYGMPIIFYAFATANGTLRAIGLNIVYRFRNATKLLPVAIGLVSILVSASGAGSSSAFIVGPLAWGICIPAGINPLMTVVSLWIGTIVGGFVPWATGGILHQGWQEEFLGMNIIWRENAYYAAFGIMAFVLVFVILKGWRTTGEVDNSIFQTPDPLTREQKITLGFMGAFILLLLIPSIFNQFVGGAFWKWMSTNMAIPVTCTIGISALSLLRCGDLKEVLSKHVNWNILFVIVLMSQYCGLADKMGVTDTLTVWLQDMPAYLIAPMLALIAAALSFCVSASTILPLLYAMVPPLAASAGIPIAAMAVPFIIGTGASSISPISTGGASCQIGAPREVTDKLFTQQLVLSILLSILNVILTFAGFYTIGL